MTKIPILALLDFEKLFQVGYDTSGILIRVVLIQEGLLISFLNENLDESKKIYLVYEQEFYDII